MSREIVFVAGKDPLEEWGGHSSYVRAHARAAMRAGFEPHLFCISRDCGTVETDYGIVHRLRSPFWRLPQPPKVGFRTKTVIFHAPLIAAGIERFLLARPGPSLIHGFGVWGCAGVSASQKLRRSGHQATPIVSVYTTLEHEFQAKRLAVNRAHGYLERIRAEADYLWVKQFVIRCEEQAYMGAQSIMFNYESVRRLLLSKWDLAGKLRKMSYTSESAFFHAQTAAQPELPGPIATLQPRNAPLVVAVSRHDPRKGLDVLLRALAGLRATGVPFRACLVGSGLLLAAHRQLADRLGLGASTLITGLVPDPYLYLQHADVFALPSLEEGSGSVALIEALQAGIAVVASNVDGIPEDVTDGDNGLLVAPGDVAELSRALARVLTNTELRQRVAGRARETFEQRFSAAAFTEALRLTYAELGFES